MLKVLTATRLKKAICIVRRGGISSLLTALRDYLIRRAGFSTEYGVSHVFNYTKCLGAPPVPLSPKPLGNGLLSMAWFIPDFSKGSGGHSTIFRVIAKLSNRGHNITVLIVPPYYRDSSRAVLEQIRLRGGDISRVDVVQSEGFVLHTVEVAVATSWDTAYWVRAFPDAFRRYYFVQDYEPAFYPMSSLYVFAEETYRMGLPCITAGPWLARVLRERHGVLADHFFLGVDANEYYPEGCDRQTDTIVLYARYLTARRAFELAVMALHEVKHRRPQTHIILFGADSYPTLPFSCQKLGVLDAANLRRLYSEASLGIALSLTNYSLVPTEMMACGLPVIELSSECSRTVFADCGGILLSPMTPSGLARCVVDLLDNPALLERMSQDGIRWASDKTWDAATDKIEKAIYSFGCDSPL